MQQITGRSCIWRMSWPCKTVKKWLRRNITLPSIRVRMIVLLMSFSRSGSMICPVQKRLNSCGKDWEIWESRIREKGVNERIVLTSSFAGTAARYSSKRKRGTGGLGIELRKLHFGDAGTASNLGHCHSSSRGCPSNPHSLHVRSERQSTIGRSALGPAGGLLGGGERRGIDEFAQRHLNL
jgi:hypothetical protein